MAVLTNQQVLDTWAALVAQQLAKAGAVNLSKAELAAAVTATNTWVDANVAGFLAALTTNAPAAATALTGQQKTFLFVYVLVTKYGLNLNSLG